MNLYPGHSLAMIPILLQAHTRALTQIKYNRDGDLLFSAAKDSTPNVWFSHNGERLGTFEGHNGAIWSLDVSSDSRLLCTGCADNSARIWDVQTGKTLSIIQTETAVRRVGFAMGDQQVALITDATMGRPSTLHIYDLRSINASKEPSMAVRRLEFGDSKQKATVFAWADCNEAIVTGHENGALQRWDPSSGKLLETNKNAHTDTLRDLQLSADRTYFITASRDTTARLFETSSLRQLKLYQTERPINSAAISPLRPEVCIAGGQEALHVTTTSSRAGQFEARFFHQVFEMETGRVRGHFGPINTVAYRPDGKGYASGAEDGYVRVHVFDPDYYDFTGAGEDILEESLIR